MIVHILAMTGAGPGNFAGFDESAGNLALKILVFGQSAGPVGEQ
ncbi:hypothetical protein [Sandarakinorhabdus sp.]